MSHLAGPVLISWTLDASARGTLIMGGAVFVSTAMLKLAREAAGCVEGRRNALVVSME
jgi:hypothetical protein